MIRSPKVRHGKLCDKVMATVACDWICLRARQGPSHALPPPILTKWNCPHLPGEETEAHRSYITSLRPPPILTKWDCPHLPDEETEAHRSYITSLRPPNQAVRARNQTQVLKPMVRIASWNLGGEGGRGDLCLSP